MGMGAGSWRREKDVLAKDRVEGPRGVDEGRRGEERRVTDFFSEPMLSLREVY